MKKILSLILILMLMALSTGCAKEEEPECLSDTCPFYPTETLKVN